MAISDYSTTPASNTSLSGIDITGTTGKVKDGDNAIRQIMADIKAGVPYLSGTNYLMESTDAGATAGPVLEFYRNSATPAASDILGNITFNGEDSAGNTQEYASIETVIVDATSTSEDGQLDFYATKAGTRTKFLSITATAMAHTGAAAYTVDAVLRPASNDGAALGESGTAWSDLFLATGGVVNWNNGNVTLTQSANALAFAGVTSGVSMDGPLAVSWAVTGTALTATSTAAGSSTSGPDFKQLRSANATTNHVLGRRLIAGLSSTGVERNFAFDRTLVADATNASEDGVYEQGVIVAGAEKYFLGFGELAAGTPDANAVALLNGQLSFPATQNPSSNINTLDDYQEGTWTPGVSFGGGTTGITYATRSGSYTKIGDMLYYNGRVTLTNKGSSTGAARITGFPFNLDQLWGSNVSYYSNLATISGQVGTLSNNGGGATTADLFMGGATSVALLTNSNFTNTSDIVFSGIAKVT